MSRKLRLAKELTEFLVPDEKELQYVGQIQEIKGSRLCEVYVPYDRQSHLYMIHPKLRRMIYMKRGESL
jgi:hypothetical protein